MKRIISIVLCALFVLSLAACGNSADTKETKAETQAQTTAEGTTAPATTQANVIKEGKINLLGKVEIELTDGWYGENPTEDEVKLYNETVDKTKFANIHVHVEKAYNGDGAEYWNEALNGNYGGGKETGKVTINGIEYYILYAADEQTILTADIDDEYYVEIDCMFFPYDKAQSQLEKISIIK